MLTGLLAALNLAPALVQSLREREGSETVATAGASRPGRGRQKRQRENR